jgi:protein-tyrosine phosphatase
MKHAAAFFVLGLAFLAAAISLRGAWWIALWPAVSFLIVAIGYAGAGASIFGKQHDGRLAWWAKLLLWPFLLVNALIWNLQRLGESANCADRIAPGIWLGRRARCREVPDDVRVIVDITAEFPAQRQVVASRSYVCLPTLDGMPSDEHKLEQMLQRLAREQRVMYIHCAQGRGRSAAVAAALLIRKGLAADVDEAERMLRAARPSIRISPAQRRLVAKISRLSPARA